MVSLAKCHMVPHHWDLHIVHDTTETFIPSEILDHPIIFIPPEYRRIGLASGIKNFHVIEHFLIVERIYE